MVSCVRGAGALPSVLSPPTVPLFIPELVLWSHISGPQQRAQASRLWPRLQPTWAGPPADRIRKAVSPSDARVDSHADQLEPPKLSPLTGI